MPLAKFGQTDVEIVYQKVWGDEKCGQDIKTMREALVETAICITHECGDQEATIRAYCRTVTDFLNHEAILETRKALLQYRFLG